jgi:RNA polymerase sigma-70 factor (ECF subfamily)
MAAEQPSMDVAQLVADHHESVYRYAFRLCGSAADAEDLTQQTFLAAHRSLGQLREPASARSWLWAILRNCFLKELRRSGPVPAADLNLDLDAIPGELPDEVEIDQERLQEALGELPEVFRLVVVMYYFEDCSYREIAERLDMPIGTVMSRLARAKGHLRTKLAEPATEGIGDRG